MRRYTVLIIAFFVTAAGISGAYLIAWDRAQRHFLEATSSLEDEVALLRARTLERRFSEARALALDRNLDEIDVALLSNEELDVSLPQYSPVERPFERRSASPFDVYRATAPYAHVIYSTNTQQGGPHIDVKVDRALPVPEIDISQNDDSDPYPTASVPSLIWPGAEVLYFFEFDTSPDFNSPNLWRYPSLMATQTDKDGNVVSDLTSRDGLILFLLLSNHRSSGLGTEISIKFPFRASAMRLPNEWGELDFEELERHARALAFGLDVDRQIEEVFQYARYIYNWGSDTQSRSPISSFRSGVGECAYINSLAAAYLEMNGIRTRLVSGFNPKSRVTRPFGGHMLTEVFDSEAGTWRVMDSYLDVLSADSSAEDMAYGGRESAMPVYSIAAKQFSRISQREWLDMGELFQFRRYGDSLGRWPMISGLSLRAGNRPESSYGLDWPLNVAPEFAASELFPETKTIYVRARYVIAPEGTQISYRQSGSRITNDDVRASRWQVKSFVIYPRKIVDLLDAVSGNRCAVGRGSRQPCRE